MFNDHYGLNQAVLSGWKTKTRRIIKSKNIIARHWNPAFNADHCYYTDGRGKCQLIDTDTNKIIIPQFKVGEVVAIAQKYSEIGIEPFPFCGAGWSNKMFVRADLMPHRIRITDIKVERLQDISDEDCIKEGVGVSATDNRIGTPFGIPFNYYVGQDIKGCRYTTPREAYATLIDKISGKGTWQSNPLVFAYEFEMVD